MVVVFGRGMAGTMECRSLDGGPREEPSGIGLDTGLACTVFPETRIAEPEEAVETDGPEQVGEREAVAEQPRSGGRPEVAIEIGNQLLRLRDRSEEHTSELQSLMRISYAVFCLKKKNRKINYRTDDLE